MDYYFQSIKRVNALQFSEEDLVAKKNAALTQIAREITNVASTVAAALVSRLLRHTASQRQRHLLLSEVIAGPNCFALLYYIIIC